MAESEAAQPTSTGHLHVSLTVAQANTAAARAQVSQPLVKATSNPTSQQPSAEDPRSTGRLCPYPADDHSSSATSSTHSSGGSPRSSCCWLSIPWKALDRAIRDFGHPGDGFANLEKNAYTVFVMAVLHCLTRGQAAGVDTRGGETGFEEEADEVGEDMMPGGEEVEGDERQGLLADFQRRQQEDRPSEEELVTDEEGKQDTAVAAAAVGASDDAEAAANRLAAALAAALASCGAAVHVRTTAAPQPEPPPRPRPYSPPAPLLPGNDVMRSNNDLTAPPSATAAAPPAPSPVEQPASAAGACRSLLPAAAGSGDLHASGSAGWPAALPRTGMPFPQARAAAASLPVTITAELFVATSRGSAAPAPWSAGAAGLLEDPLGAGPGGGSGGGQGRRGIGMRDPLAAAGALSGGGAEQDAAPRVVGVGRQQKRRRRGWTLWADQALLRAVLLLRMCAPLLGLGLTLMLQVWLPLLLLEAFKQADSDGGGGGYCPVYDKELRTAKGVVSAYILAWVVWKDCSTLYHMQLNSLRIWRNDPRVTGSPSKTPSAHGTHQHPHLRKLHRQRRLDIACRRLVVGAMNLLCLGYAAVIVMVFYASLQLVGRSGDISDVILSGVNALFILEIDDVFVSLPDGSFEDWAEEADAVVGPQRRALSGPAWVFHVVTVGAFLGCLGYLWGAFLACIIPG